jgi:Flp pilus assembly pilin Flp
METLRKIFDAMRARLRCVSGQTVIEYVLVIVLISLVLLLAFRTTRLQTAITNASTNIADQVDPT